MPDYLEFLKARGKRSCGGGAGDHDHHGVAHTHLQLVGQHPAENDPVRSRLKIGEFAIAHGLIDG